MKKFKNNKGVTGIDIVMSILIILISVGIISMMYSKYLEKTKEVKRNTEATNLAREFIEYVETANYEDIKQLITDNNSRKLEFTSRNIRTYRYRKRKINI